MIDIRMPPDLTDDGARAAHHFRQELPAQPILLLSQHVETRHSVRLVSTGAFGYLLKDRVLRVDDFLDALTRVAQGGSELDPGVVDALLRAGTSVLAHMRSVFQKLSIPESSNSHRRVLAVLAYLRSQ